MLGGGIVDSSHRRFVIRTFAMLLASISILAWLANHSGAVEIHGRILSDAGAPLANTTIHYRIAAQTTPVSFFQMTEEEIVTDTDGAFAIRADAPLVAAFSIYFIHANCIFPPEQTPDWYYSIDYDLVDGKWVSVEEDENGDTIRKGEHVLSTRGFPEIASRNALPLEYGWKHHFSTQRFGTYESPLLYRAVICAERAGT